MLRNIFASIAVLALAASAQAGVIISQSGSPTANMPGFTTWTLSATTDEGEIVGFDFASDPSYGFFGAMNQINPAGNPTIFQDSNGFFAFVGADVSQDSQFLYKAADVVVPAGFAEEGPDKLRAVFASANSLGTTNVPFVQLATPDASSGIVEYLGTVTVKSSTGEFLDVRCQGMVPEIPEPASIALLGLAVAGLVGVRRR